MSSPAKKLYYPHIAERKDIAGGSPHISGTRTTVRSIAGYYQMGINADEIIATLPHLSNAQVHSALAYYFDHQAQVEAELHETSNEDYWSTKVMPHPNEVA